MTEIRKTREEYLEALEEIEDPKRRESYRRTIETFKPWETLSPDLVEYLDEDGPFGASIRHPLLYDIMYSPGVRDGHLNEILSKKQQAASNALKEKRYDSYVWLHERPYRLWAFMNIHSLITDHQVFWDLVSGIWIDSENIWQNYDEWRKILKSKRPGSTTMMTAEEIIKLADLPHEITIYRGYRKVRKQNSIWGFSWTLEKHRAEWFARRFAEIGEGNAMVATGTVSKANVIAYFSGRGEEEIVVLPEHVNINKQEVVS